MDLKFGQKELSIPIPFNFIKIRSKSCHAQHVIIKGHDVFLSFRGEDTRTNFTSHLYDALTQKHIRTYKDNKSLEIGNSITPELLVAIETSRFAIVVLSRNFATSKWCLEEISKVVDCRERGKLTIIPVFYHVSPSHVRHQTDCFEQGFINHQVDPEISPHKVATWRSAFAKVGDIKGIHVTPHMNESEVIGEIVRNILKAMQDPLPTNGTNHLVGIESRVNEVKRILSMDSSDVHFIGICGMSGIGKTTLAEVVYEGIQNQFEESSFIENIKDISKENDSTSLCKLQQKLLDDILKGQSICVRSVKHGQTLLSTKLHGLKVLIVLDDVNHLDQLTYLAGGHAWFGPGSRIILTTTNVNMLNPRIINDVYRCEELKGDEALRLFCQSAFSDEHPTHDYEKVSTDIVKLAGGLPLALDVYGSILCGKDESYWKDMLKKLRDQPQEKVLGRLEIVFGRLDRDQRNAFIYIACFLKGRNIDLIKDILRNIGLHPGCEVADLINMSLITINHDESVWMHDLLQQMCWEILRKKSESYNGNLTAIKSRNDVVDILSSKPKGMRTIEIINLEPYKDEVDDCFDDPECFSKMKKLKFLRISNIHFRQGLDYLSNDLRIIEWNGCSLKSLPSTFEPKSIYELEMCCSQLETLWEKDLDLPNLRSINLSFSKNLTKIPDLTSTTNLVKLNLEGCTKLTELHESVLCQKRLRYMNLKGCIRLQSLGRSTMEMEALEALILSGCSDLEYIPELGHNMKRLEHLYVDGTSIKKLPDNLGEMCHLRKLDASGTSIEEIPSSFHHLKRLRLLRVHRCQLLSKTGGFLYSDMGILSSGLRELDLSYCNLSVVPHGIGLLYRLTNLDLSGNDFVSLPASLGLLSNLRMLCLNDCKRLQSLPKLSIVNEDTLYGLKIRYNYYISREGVDLSKVHATSNNSSPTISCLNCPKLAENENGSLAEKILNSYLQLRTNYWISPEAVFEIVGAGSGIPSGFKPLFYENLILEGPWIGVAICAIVAAQHVDANMAKYVITAHIHIEEQHWKIPLPINLLLAGLKTQLVFYWTVTEDLQRVIDSKKKNKLGVSFSIEPRDGNLQVTGFGVRLIRNEDILQLKLHERSTSLVVHNLFRVTLSLPTYLQSCLHACEANTDLYSSSSISSSIIKLILEYGEHQHSLEAIHKIIKSLLEINQEVLSECREEWRHAQLFSLVYDYYRISHGTSELYNDFVRLLKDASDSWLSTKLALEQIVVKSREDDYTREEMRQQLNDLEAAKSIRFSDSFVTSFAHICKQTVIFSRYLNRVIIGNEKFKSMKVLVKVSCIMIASIFSVMATYMGDYELLCMMKDIMLNSMWLDMIESFSIMGREWFNKTGRHIKKSYDRELQIWDFNDNAILLQELKNKMTRSLVAKENEVEMVNVKDMLGKKIDNTSKMIEDMSIDAHKYSHDIMEAGITFNQFIAEGKLQVTRSRVCFGPDDDMLQLKRFEDPIREAISNLVQATAFLPASLHCHLRPCEADMEIFPVLLVNRDRYDRTRIKYMISDILECTKTNDNYEKILVILEILIRRVFWLRDFCYTKESFEVWGDGSLHPLFVKQSEIDRATSKLCNDLASLLEGIGRSWENVPMWLDHMIQKSKVGMYTNGDILLGLNNVDASESVGCFDDFVTSFKYICDETCVLFGCMSSVIYGDQKLESLKVIKEIAKVSSLRIIGILSIMATWMGDIKLLQEMEDVSSNPTLLYLMQCFSRNCGKWFVERKRVMKRDYGGELWIWDCYCNGILVHELKKKMGGLSCLTKENEREMVGVRWKLDRKLCSLIKASHKIRKVVDDSTVPTTLRESPLNDRAELMSSRELSRTVWDLLDIQEYTSNNAYVISQIFSPLQNTFGDNVVLSDEQFVNDDKSCCYLL